MKCSSLSQQSGSPLSVNVSSITPFISPVPERTHCRRGAGGVRGIPRPHTGSPREGPVGREVLAFPNRRPPPGPTGDTPPAPAELRREPLVPATPSSAHSWSPGSRGGKCAKLQLSGVVAPAAEAASPARRAVSGAGEAAGKCPAVLSLRPGPALPDSPPPPFPSPPRWPHGLAPLGARPAGAGVSACECARECVHA